MPGNGGRNGSEWDRVRAIVIARESNCYLCHQPVNKALSGRHSLGPTVDHVRPLAGGGALLDLANLRLAHRRCNERKGDRALKPVADAGPSREWLTV